MSNAIESYLIMKLIIFILPSKQVLLFYRHKINKQNLSTSKKKCWQHLIYFYWQKRPLWLFPFIKIVKLRLTTLHHSLLLGIARVLCSNFALFHFTCTSLFGVACVDILINLINYVFV